MTTDLTSSNSITTSNLFFTGPSVSITVLDAGVRISETSITGTNYAGRFSFKITNSISTFAYDAVRIDFPSPYLDATPIVLLTPSSQYANNVNLFCSFTGASITNNQYAYLSVGYINDTTIGNYTAGDYVGKTLSYNYSIMLNKGMNNY